MKKEYIVVFVLAAIAGVFVRWLIKNPSTSDAALKTWS